MKRYYQCGAAPTLILMWDLVSPKGQWLNIDTGTFVADAEFRTGPSNTVTFEVPSWALVGQLLLSVQTARPTLPWWTRPELQLPEGL